MQNSSEPLHYQILNKAREMEKKGINIIHMEIGDPEIDTDHRIINAMYRAALEGYTHYGEAKGLPKFRELISQYLSEKLNINSDPERICVVPGSKSAIYIALKTLGRVKARVAIIEPTWGLYYSFIEELGYRSYPIRLSIENKWELTEEDMKKLEGKDFIIVVNPSNPTGKILDKDIVEAITDTAYRNNSIVIADEIYFNLTYNRKFYSFLETEYDNIISLYSFSKSFAMTGFRLGWVYSHNRKFIDTITKNIQLLLTNVPEFIQYAGIKALELRDEIVERNRRIYMEKTIFLSKGLKKLGFKFVDPEAAFYIFTEIPDEFNSSIEFAEKLLLQKHIAVAPGTAFGEYPRYVRFTAAIKDSRLRESISRLREFIENNSRI